MFLDFPLPEAAPYHGRLAIRQFPCLEIGMLSVDFHFLRLPGVGRTDPTRRSA